MTKKKRTVRKQSWKKELFKKAAQQYKFWEVVRNQLDAVYNALCTDPYGYYRRSRPEAEEHFNHIRYLISEETRRSEAQVLACGVLGTKAELQQAKLFALKNFLTVNHENMHFLTPDGRHRDTYGCSTSKQFKEHISRIHDEVIEEVAKREKLDHERLKRNGYLDEEEEPELFERTHTSIRDVQSLISRHKEAIKRLQTEAILKYAIDPNDKARGDAKDFMDEVKSERAVKSYLDDGVIVEEVYQDEIEEED